MTKENFSQFVEEQINDAVDLIFIDVHSYAGSTSGDITPEQQLQLNKLQEDLKNLIVTQTLQNLTDDKKKELGFDVQEDGELKEWTVPVCRTGWGSRSITVTARTEQEAIDAAIDAAGDESFSENDAEYSAPDGAHLT